MDRSQESSISKGPLLSDVLKVKPDLIEQLALCLDRQMRLIPNWKHFSNELKVDAETIHLLEQYADFSPTIRLFEHLETVQPDLTIQRLKQAFIEIRRNDLFKLLTTTAALKDNELVNEAITSRYLVAASPNLGLLDEMALELDVDSRILGNWRSLALELGVPRNTFKQFERRSTRSPTNELFDYLASTHPKMTVKSLEEELKNMQRKDLIAILQEKNPQASLMVQRKHLAAIETRQNFVLPLYESILGKDHPFVATTLSWIGKSFQELGEYDNAIKYATRALNIRETLLGRHQETARSYYDLGVALSAKRDYERALEHLQHAVELQEEVLDTYEELILSHQEMAVVLKELGKDQEAEREMERACECAKRLDSLEVPLQTLRISEKGWKKSDPVLVGNK